MIFLFSSVPQVSVRMKDIPEDHFKMIQFYTNYWIENQSVLLDGKFVALSPQSNYPVLTSGNSTKKIISFYDNQVVTIKANDPAMIDLINAKMTSSIILKAEDDLGAYQFTIKDCFGEVKAEGDKNLGAGLHVFEVPVSGMISLERAR